MTAESRWHPLCDAAQIADPGSRGFELDNGDAPPLRLFVVNKGGAMHAYVNSCPHTGAPLEWMPDQFLDFDNSFIQCAIHGALFRPEDGRCVRGPCVGDALRALPLRVRDGVVMVAPGDAGQLPSR